MAGEWDHGAALSLGPSRSSTAFLNLAVSSGVWRLRDVALGQPRKLVIDTQERKRKRNREKSEGRREKEKDPFGAPWSRRLIGRGSGGRHCFRDIPMLFVFSRSRRLSSLSFSLLHFSSGTPPSPGRQRTTTRDGDRSCTRRFLSVFLRLKRRDSSATIQPYDSRGQLSRHTRVVHTD